MFRSKHLEGGIQFNSNHHVKEIRENKQFSWYANKTSYPSRKTYP